MALPIYKIELQHEWYYTKVGIKIMTWGQSQASKGYYRRMDGIQSPTIRAKTSSS